MVLVAALPLLAACGDGDGGDDAATRSAEALVCLSNERRQRVVDAAVLRGLAQPVQTPGYLYADGRPQTVPEWRESQPERFAQACEVVVAADRLTRGAPAGADNGGSLWTVLWPLLIGAALTLVTTFLTTGWRERMTEIRRHSAALRTATSDYVSAVQSFMDLATDRHQNIPTGQGLDEPRRRLQRALDETPRPDRIPEVGRAGNLLGAGALGRGLASGWAAPSARDPSSTRAQSIGAAVDELRTATEAIAASREHAVRTAIRRGIGRVSRIGQRLRRKARTEVRAGRGECDGSPGGTS